MNKAYRNGYIELWRNSYGGAESNLPRRRYSVTSHSPDGINFGYGGSGPAELAARMLTGSGIPKTTLWFGDLYSELKWRLVANLPRTPSADAITIWVFTEADGWTGSEFHKKPSTGQWMEYAEWMEFGRIYIPIKSIKEWKQHYQGD